MFVLSKKNDEIAVTNIQCKDLQILVENLRTQIIQKVINQIY